jgi:excisionase family DNA binding protein
MNSASEIQSPLLTIKEAGKYLRVSRTVVYRLLSDGSIASVRVQPRRQMVPLRSLDEYISKTTRYQGGTNGLR